MTVVDVIDPKDSKDQMYNNTINKREAAAFLLKCFIVSDLFIYKFGLINYRFAEGKPEMLCCSKCYRKQSLVN